MKVRPGRNTGLSQRQQVSCQCFSSLGVALDHNLGAHLAQSESVVLDPSELQAGLAVYGRGDLPELVIAHAASLLLS